MLVNVITIVAYSHSLERMVAYEGIVYAETYEQKLDMYWTLRPRRHDYALGRTPARYPVPALRLAANWNVDQVTDKLDALIIDHVGVCDCCGGTRLHAVAVWDFNANRCFDYNIKYGQYQNEGDLDRGRAFHNATKDLTGYA
jgi:hypothetical protein